MREAGSIYWIKNKEQLNARSIAWHKQHPEYKKQWAIKNIEKKRAYWRKWYNKKKEGTQKEHASPEPEKIIPVRLEPFASLIDVEKFKKMKP